MNKKNTQVPQPFVTVKIKCRPLVKAYLERNFGIPVQIPESSVLHKLAASQLLKQNPRSGPWNQEYNESIDLALTRKNFKCDGYEISQANTAQFNDAVTNHIKTLSRNVLDAILISQESQLNWKKEYFELLNLWEAPQYEIEKKKRLLRERLEQHEIDIKKAIEIVVYKFLGLDFDVYSYDTVKKDYYRYRTRRAAEKFLPAMSPNIK